MFIPKFLFAAAALHVCTSLSAQNEITLKQCVEYGIQNSLTLKKAALEVNKNKQKEKEVLATGFPQINTNFTFNDNLNLLTQLIPGEIIGKPGTLIPARFGTQYNFTAGFTASQMIYNQTLLVAVKAARVAEDLANLGVEKTQQQLIYDIATAYYAVQVSNVQKEIVESNLQKVSKLKLLTKAQYENGLAKRTDYDRLQVSETNLQTELENIDQTAQYQASMLKFFMGMKLDSALKISKIIEPSALQLSTPQHDVTNNIDAKIIESQKELNELNIKQFYAGYVPALNANATYNWQNMGNEVHLVGDQANWYNNTMVGLTLTVPIFDGLNKHYKATQAKIQQYQLDLDALYLAESIRLQNQNAYNKLKTSKSSVKVQEKNMKLSEEIYASTQEQYNGGLVSLSELMNAETAQKEAQNNYLRSLVQVKLSELDLLKASGNIDSIVK